MKGYERKRDESMLAEVYNAKPFALFVKEAV